jgi:preprotein translocase subunit YajC
LGQLIIIVAMFALLWLFLIRPQRQRAQAQRELISNVQTGDEILTVGGLIGRVRHTGEDELELEIAPETRVRVSRRAVASVLTPGDQGETLEPAVLAQDEEVRS